MFVPRIGGSPFTREQVDWVLHNRQDSRGVTLTLLGEG